MGEIFRRSAPSRPMQFSGERMTSEVGGQIEAEHLHRYFLARELAKGLDVLDIASGEGYGSAYLAQVAASVTGVDVSSDAVDHASKEYGGSNLRFVLGDGQAIPCAAASFDFVTSFETIEHVVDHQSFLREVRRVLRPGGVALISTPESRIYSPPNSPANNYHLNEMTAEDFQSVLTRAFANVRFFRQTAILGTAILSDRSPSGAANWVFERRGDEAFEVSVGIPKGTYVVALASNSSLPPIGASVYIDRYEPYHQIAHERKAFADAEKAFHAEEGRLRNEVRQLTEELTALREAIKDETK
jgi:2-polyprenyl-3-methyl-5-hydroxy-6-metoxy-1,4-benzoquinol methylase